MTDFNKIKEDAARVETTTSDFQIDDVKELHYALVEGRKAALKDIKEDIKKAYPGNEEKQKEEMKTVDITLKRLERAYKHKAKKDVGNFGKLADKYINDLEHIAGVEITTKMIESDYPEDFWKDAAGWYEKSKTIEREKDPAKKEEKKKKKQKIMKITDKISFEEEIIESMIEKGNWKDKIDEYHDGKGKIANVEDFQNWLTTNQEDLRKLVLRPLGSGKYIVDFSNISKEFEKATKESALESDFIARNIGLADLLSNRTDALTIWGKNGIQTGILAEEHERKNGLKGGYLTTEGSYLTLWHGSIISLEKEDSIDDEVAAGLFAGEEAESEERTEESIADSKIIEIEATDKSGKVILKNRVKYTPSIDLSKSTPGILEKHKASVVARRRKLEGISTGDLKKEFEYKTTITTIDSTISATEPVKKEITTNFKATTYSKKLKYEKFDEDFDYQSEQYPNIFITIPMGNQKSYILAIMVQKGKGPKTLKIFESTDLSKIKKRLNNEIDGIDKGWVSKKPMGWKQMQAIEFDETCSKETIDKYLRQTKGAYLKNVKKVIVRGNSYKHTLELTTSTDPITFKDTEISDEGIAALKIHKDTTKLKFEGNKKLTKNGLAKLRDQFPNITEITLDHVKLSEKGALAEIARFKKLDKLVIDRSVIVTSDLEAIGSSTSLKKLELINLPTVSDLNVKMMLKDSKTKNTKLSQLTTLRITGSRITDESIQYIKNLQNLETLDLSGNKDITYKAIQELVPVEFYSELGKDDPSGTNLKLDEINLSNTSIDNAALPYLKYYSVLMDIDLSNTKIDDKATDTLLKIIKPNWLKTLNLKDTKISEKGFRKFSELLLQKYFGDHYSKLETARQEKDVEKKKGKIKEIFKLAKDEKIGENFKNLITPKGEKYTFENLIFVYFALSPQEITAAEEASEASEFETLKTKKLTALNTLFKDINRKYNIEWRTGYPTRDSKQYLANIKGSGGYWIKGYLDKNDFELIGPNNHHIKLDDISGTFKVKVKKFLNGVEKPETLLDQYFTKIEELADKFRKINKRAKIYFPLNDNWHSPLTDKEHFFRNTDKIKGLAEQLKKRQFEVKVNYDYGEIGCYTAIIKGSLDTDKFEILLEEGDKKKKITLEKLTKLFKDKDKEIEEENERLETLQNEIQTKVEKKLSSISKNLSIKIQYNAKYGNAERCPFTVYFNNKEIGELVQQYDDSKKPYTFDISQIKVSTIEHHYNPDKEDPHTITNDKVEGTNLEEKMKKLILAKAEEEKGKALARIHTLIKDAEKELNEIYSASDIEISLTLENEETKLANTNNPYLRFDIYLHTSNSSPVHRTEAKKRKIGCIDDWILSKSKIGLYEKETEIKTKDKKEAIKKIVEKHIDL